jgi:hypothetical protein
LLFDILKYINTLIITYLMKVTIYLSKKMKKKLKNLGRTGDTYDDIIKTLYAITSKNMLFHYVYDISDSVSIDDAIKEAKLKWK